MKMQRQIEACKRKAYERAEANLEGCTSSASISQHRRSDVPSSCWDQTVNLLGRERPAIGGDLGCVPTHRRLRWMSKDDVRGVLESEPLLAHYAMGVGGTHVNKHGGFNCRVVAPQCRDPCPSTPSPPQHPRAFAAQALR